MRVVIYDREDMEPITVITLTGQSREFLREIENGERGPEITFAVRRPMRAADFTAVPEHPEVSIRKDTCRLRFESIWDGAGRTRRRVMWLVTTVDGESALLLKSTFLPGQTAAVNEVRRDAFLDGLMAAMGVR